MAADYPRSALVRAIDGRVYYGWVIVACCFVGAMLTFAIIYSFSVFFGYIGETFAQTQANTALIFSLQSFVTFGGAAVLGVLVDRYGVRRLLVVGALLVGAGLVGASQIQAYPAVVLSYGVVAAAGLSLVYVISYATVPRWFDRRRGTATAVATAGAGAGILVGPQIAASLIGLAGWQNAYLLMMAGTVWLLFVLALLLADRPEDLGLNAADLAEFPEGRAEMAGATREWREQLATIADTARSGPFLSVFGAYFCIGVPISFIAAHVVEFAKSVGIGQSVGVLAISIVGGMNFFGKFVAGPVSDRIGIPRTLSACGVLLSVPLFGLATVRTPVAVLGLVVVFGLGYGGAIALLSPTIAELFGTDDINALFGLTSIAFAVTGALVPYLAGLGYDVFGTYTAPLLVVGAVGLLSVPGIEIARRWREPT